MCSSVANGGGDAQSVQFALSGCRSADTTHRVQTHGAGTLSVFRSGDARIVWQPPFEHGTASHPTTFLGKFALHVDPNPDEAESPAGSCPSGETEDAITGTITSIVTAPRHSTRASGAWSMELCGPPTALEPATVFRLHVAQPVANA